MGTFLLYYILALLIFIIILLVHPNGHGSFFYHTKFTLFVVLSSTMAVLAAPRFLFRLKHPLNIILGSFLLKNLTKLMGIKWELRGAKEIADGEGGVVVANHQSGMDILGFFNICEVIGLCVPVSKKELLYVVPFGIVAWMAGVLFIDRHDRNKSIKVLSETADLLQNKKTKLWLFPEGTRNKNALQGDFLPFKKGAFRVAIENQVPLYPLIFSPYYFISDEKRHFGKGKIIIQALKPIPTAGLGMEDMGELMEKTRKIMQDEYNALRKEVYASLPQDHPVLIKDERKVRVLCVSCSSVGVALLLLLVIVCAVSDAARYRMKFVIFVILSAIFATWPIPLMFFRPRHWKNALIPAWGARQTAKLLGVNYEVRGKENIIQNSGCVVLINHQSGLDLCVLAELWPVLERCTVISKKEVLYLGPFGWASWLWGTIFIDRLNAEQARNTVNSTAEIINKRKARLLLFPEGKRHSGTTLLPFKKGAFHVAIASETPIQPVVVSRYYFLNDKLKIFDSGTSHINILPPIPTKGLTKDNLEELMNKTYEVMNKKFQESSQEAFSRHKESLKSK